MTPETGLALLRTTAGTTTGLRPRGAVGPGAATPPAPATPLSPGPGLTEAPAPVLQVGLLEVGPAEVGRLEVVRVSCGALDDVDPQALGLTYWFDGPAEAPAEPLTVAFSGRRTDLKGPPGPGDSFLVQTRVDDVVPGAGRSAVTQRVTGITAGEWEVAAARVRHGGRTGPAVTARGRTAYAPVVRASGPGVLLGAWPLMVALGTVGALATQGFLSAARDLPSLRVLVLTLLACIVGTVGAKVYYLATHRGDPTGTFVVGMSVQGFVLASIVTLSLGALRSGLAVGEVLDVTTPGLLYGMTIGRFGCFFGGCCAGRVTASRWGLWSSNRRLGARRIPVQLMESAAAAAIATAALLLVVAVEPLGGTVFAGAIAAYTFTRQVLFPLRTIPRDTTHGRRITMAVSALVLATAVVIAATA